MFMPIAPFVRGRCIEPDMRQEFVQEHVELIAKHEQEFLDRRTVRERIGDAIAGAAGSLTFVGVHLLLLACGLG